MGRWRAVFEGESFHHKAKVGGKAGGCWRRTQAGSLVVWVKVLLGEMAGGLGGAK
ncbi:hypothetical protein [Bartonella tribocorum]|uniref:hypothetical protein n=1 Tax=Bartonella tribocorum TaxID=85701 RepID=UPI002361FD6B|nr:hypothetical protein [Bartonella tribocorum]